MNKLCLGTAAIGLESYGIANRTGKPNDAEMTAMLDAFIGAGGRWIDTAAAYGDAEERLHSYGLPGRGGVQVVTKMEPNVLDGVTGADVEPAVLEDFWARVRCLGRVPDVYLLHSSRYVFRDDILRAMKAVRAVPDPVTLIRGAVKIGVSCYEPAEVLAAIEAGYGAVQVPYSILDQRCEAAMARAKARGLMVFARAPFVQGLVFLGASDIPERLAHARPYVARLRERCHSHDRVVAASALLFSLQCPWVDCVVFGAEQVAQVVEDIMLPPSEPDLWLNLRNEFRDIPSAVVNPSLWAKPEVPA